MGLATVSLGAYPRQALFHTANVTFGVLIIGHRGASAAYPENTLAAFAGAAEQGADGIETDLRRTADGEVAIHHDAALPDGRVIVELRRDELPDWIPTLDDVLEACGHFEVVNLEVKNWPEDPDFDGVALLADLVVGSLADRAELHDRVLVSSFHLPTIDRVRALDDRIATGWLTGVVSDPIRFLERAADHGHQAFHPHVAFVDAPLVERTHELGMRLHTWTVDEPARIRELAELGVDAVITNVPDIARAVVRETMMGTSNEAGRAERPPGGVTQSGRGSVGE